MDDWKKYCRDALRDMLRAADRMVPAFTIAITVIAVPAALLYLLPSILGLFATPPDRGIDLYAVNRPLAFTFLDSDGKDVGHRGAVVGERLNLDDMPAYLPAAFIAMEDRRFFSHKGIDPRGLARALLIDLRARRWVAGGSTITQQTAKIVYTNQQRTMSRKLTELIDAAGLEKALSKQQILQLYLNRIYLGSAAYGVDGAARVYFGISARHVSLAQAAMLATLTRAPSVFSPRRDLLAAQQRASLVLDAMVATGAVSEDQAAAARAHPASVIDRSSLDARNFFLDTAADQARQLAYPGGATPSGDLTVRTTLEPKLQEDARIAATRAIARSGARSRVGEAAVVIMKPDGAVSALVGGIDYQLSVFNRATQAHRQPGSAFKPFVYLAALEAGLQPWDQRDDEAVDIGGYKPNNFGNHSYGTLTLAEALAHSVNTITANLAQEIGIRNVVAAAQRCGIVSKLEPNASLALGTSEVTPLELTGAYAAFANGGFRVTPYFVTEVTGNDGKPLYHRAAPAPRRVIAAATNRQLVAMLAGVVTSGTGTGASLSPREAAGKTGTTQDSKDAWFVGFTTDYVTAVWVGNDDSTPTRGVTGGTLPAQIWREAMRGAESGKPLKPLDRASLQPPDEDGAVTAGDSAYPGDDEAASSTAQDGNAQAGMAQAGEDTAPSENTPRLRHRDGGLLGWLFGSGDEEPPPAPITREGDDH